LKTCFVFTSLDNDDLHEFAINEIGRYFNIVGFLRSNRNSKSISSRIKEMENVDYIFNFLSPKILPAEIIMSARISSINFHPGSYEYPGVGSASLCIFDGKRTYGVSAHLMEETIDSGAIICERFFEIPDKSNCETLFSLALSECKPLLHDTLELLQINSCPSKIRSWSRPAVARAEFDDWLTLLKVDSNKEIDQKITAAVHPVLPGPYVRVGSHVFTYLRTESHD
jgi:methionyl-tRNA formyltransferase